MLCGKPHCQKCLNLILSLYKIPRPDPDTVQVNPKSTGLGFVYTLAKVGVGAPPPSRGDTIHVNPKFTSLGSGFVCTLAVGAPPPDPNTIQVNP